ncbi:uncharacterized protein EV420DRAFT_1486538 [Desarmillaria tabescens]|uniref:Uncharacterized protein n=1 Tax=Armillaria tabescens TaxID=1929756 RepID=A0AA39MLN6_ARMTA|nr:uncharacterized protein EV420DRAFT_1486538 [Desarmillaria tabescens]KAK0438887.1 hypothetical protein EV420DRAFT_1486538 [Desarmillaria tabescens]
MPSSRKQMSPKTRGELLFLCSRTSGPTTASHSLRVYSLGWICSPSSMIRSLRFIGGKSWHGDIVVMRIGVAEVKEQIPVRLDDKEELDQRKRDGRVKAILDLLVHEILCNQFVVEPEVGQGICFVDFSLWFWDLSISIGMDGDDGLG